MILLHHLYPPQKLPKYLFEVLVWCKGM